MRASPIVLLLCAFFCLTQAALNCGTGVATTADNGCICRSGWTSSGGVNCNNAPSNLCSDHPIINDKADNFPRLSSTSSFSLNTLTAAVVGDYTSARQFTSIKAGSSDKCKLGFTNSYWSAAFTGCQDIFTLNLPWVNHGDCGFVEFGSNAVNQVFVTEVGAEFTDNLTPVNGLPGLTRKSAGSFKIYVNFPKQVIVSIESVVVQSIVLFDAAITRDEYNPATSTLSVQVTSVILWPNQLMGEALYVQTPAGISAVGAVAQSNIQCTDTAGTSCSQTWDVEFAHLAASCSYDGHYNLSLKVFTCRDAGSLSSTCTNANANIGFDIVGSNICASVSATASVTGLLRAFTDNTLSVVAPSYLLGSTGFFYADINAGGSAPASITFTDIKLNRGDAAGDLTVFSTTGTVVPSAAFGQIAVNNGRSFFSVYFDSRLFNTVQPRGSATFKFTATCTVVFQGNQKRNVEFVFDEKTISPVAKFSLSQASAENQETATSEPMSMGALIGGIVGGVAGLALVSVGLAFVIIKMRQPKAVPSTSA